MIKGINIQGFRGINSLSIIDFRKINLFIGKNNCGKTSILEALFLIIGITNPELPRNIHFFRNLFLTQNDDFRFIFYKLDFNSRIKIEAEIQPDQYRTLLIRPQFSSLIPENGSEISAVSDTNISSSTTMLTENVDKLILESLIKKGKNIKSKTFLSEISIKGNKHEFKAPKNYKETLKGIFINSETAYKDLSHKIENILVRKQKELLLEPLRNIDSQIRDISLGSNGMIYLDLGYSVLVPINLLGDGIRRMLSILAKILDTKNGIILLDEIENGLHYSSLKIFLKYLIKMSMHQNVQLFITTHSKETLIKLSEIMGSNELSKLKSEINTFTIRKHKGDKIISYPYDFEKLEHAVKQDIEMR